MGREVYFPGPITSAVQTLHLSNHSAVRGSQALSLSLSHTHTHTHTCVTYKGRRTAIKDPFCKCSRKGLYVWAM